MSTGAGGGARTGLVRLWHAPLGAHLALLALLLIVAFPVMTPDGAYTSDEGAYALQVRALEDGGWAYDYRAAPHDPDRDFFPVVLSDSGAGGERYPYAKHPAFPLLLRAASAAFGPVIGLHLLQLLAVVGTAAAAWLLAGELDRSLSRPAFWLAAASPVLVNGYLIWAHAPSAALAGFALVAALRVAERGLRGWPPIALAVTLAGGALLRSEAVLFAATLVAALAWATLRRRGIPSAALTAAVTGGPTVVATYVESRWVESIVGGATQVLGVRHGQGLPYVEGRIRGGWHVLFRGAYADDGAAALSLLAVLAVAVLGAVALRRRRPDGWVTRLAVACTVATAALAARLAIAPGEPVTGLFAAWPIALLGLLLVRWRAAAPGVRLLGLTGVLYLLAVLATQYPEGGGLEWGGRFLSPATALVAVLAVLGLRDRVHSLGAGGRDSRQRRVAVASVTAVAVASAGFGLAAVGWRKATTDRLIAAVARHPAEVTVTVEPSLPRLGWRLHGQAAWMLAAEDRVPFLLRRLRERGVERVAAIVPRDFPLTGLAYREATVAHEPALADLHGKLVIFSP